MIRERDKGVCALCGLDTIALRKEYERIDKGEWWRETNDRATFRKTHGIPPGRASTDWWDADHIVPVIEGGGETGIENYRTLCIPCHRKATKELHGRMKKKRIDAKALPLLAGVSELSADAVQK